ncbi:uncharacterized protein LOC130636826 [Hydractinia symbiolongicarpus]|uniref:uncharacterized protein LOC130636826 n=1 Tax=Hydractinia symbiolongicarpus TaxID=13093 RepID=UPI00254C54C8|nr:uncharacterized protein LOC130636826 [Hydractinia symbiolongicarpus]
MDHANVFFVYLSALENPSITMALSGATAAQLSSLLECKICLDTYHQPKQLNCGHTYCQHCLDALAKFNADGTAEIRCPLRCSRKTKLDSHETTSTLGNTYVVNDILNELLNVGKGNSQCQQSNECKQTVSHSCTTCSGKICSKCQNIHSCINKSFTSVTFNEKLQEIQPLCEEHNSHGRFVCIDCDNKFTCLYCIHRSHKNHERRSIAEFGEEARKWFQSSIASFDKTKVVLEKLTKEYDESLKSFKCSREAFVRELKIRKLKRIEDYLKKLNTEEENLLLRFDQKMKEFESKIFVSELTLDTRMQEFSKCMEEFNSKCDFELVAWKLEIERKHHSLLSFPRVIPSYSMHLKHLNEQDCLTNLLGELKISVRDVNIINPYKFPAYKYMMDETEKRPSHALLETNLQTLLVDLKGYKESVESVNRGCGKETKRDVRTKTVALATKYYNFQELEEIIQDGDIEKLHLILINNPNIVTMRGDYNNTLLIKAAHYNKPSVVKYLINARSDVNAVDGYKRNAYHCCAWNGHQDVLKVLINHDVRNINNVDDNHETPLHDASRNEHIECVKLLLFIPSINVNIRNDDGETAYDLAKNDSVKRLLWNNKGFSK